jgi:hypothetical protein
MCLLGILAGAGRNATGSVMVAGINATAEMRRRGDRRGEEIIFEIKN